MYNTYPVRRSFSRFDVLVYKGFAIYIYVSSINLIGNLYGNAFRLISRLYLHVVLCGIDIYTFPRFSTSEKLYRSQ